MEDLCIKLAFAWKLNQRKAARKAKAKKKKTTGKGSKFGKRTTATSNMGSTLVSQKSSSNLGKT